MTALVERAVYTVLLLVLSASYTTFIAAPLNWVLSRLEAGWEVRGSDQPLYPPTSTMVAALGVPVAEGYAPENLDWNPDLVVLGFDTEDEARRALAVLSSPDVLAFFSAQVFWDAKRPIQKSLLQSLDLARVLRGQEVMRDAASRVQLALFP